MEAAIAGALLAVALTTTISLIGSARATTSFAARRGQASALAVAKADELMSKVGNETQALAAVGPAHPNFEWEWTVVDASDVAANSTPALRAGRLSLISVTVEFPSISGRERFTYERLRRNP
jgi:hypothetical protein